MSYNLLLFTNFESNGWTFVNCSLKNSILTSTNRVFGVYQDLILPDPTRLYFRATYKALNKLKSIKIGIQNEPLLEANEAVPKLNKLQKLSVVDIAKQEKIRLHIIFESDKEVNKVLIQEPLLVDLNRLRKSTWTRFLLDRTLSFRGGHSYINLYNENEILPSSEDFKDYNLEQAKIGSIIRVKEKTSIQINAKFIKDRYYIAKLDLEEINEFGNIYFKYGIIKSTKVKDQIYIVFKANEDNKLELILDNSDVFNYLVNLKHIMVIDITKMKVMKDEIQYLPFI